MVEIEKVWHLPGLHNLIILLLENLVMDMEKFKSIIEHTLYGPGIEIKMIIKLLLMK